jgi:hypothetical protein
VILCFIHWRDACTEEAADPNTPISPNPLVDLYEWGWLIQETDEAVSLAMEWVSAQAGNLAEAGGRAGRYRLHIPKVNIIERKNYDTDKLFRQPAKRKKREA